MALFHSFITLDTLFYFLHRKFLSDICDSVSELVLGFNMLVLNI